MVVWIVCLLSVKKHEQMARDEQRVARDEQKKEQKEQEKVKCGGMFMSWFGEA